MGQFRARELNTVAFPIGSWIEDEIGKQRLVLIAALQIVDERRIAECPSRSISTWYR